METRNIKRPKQEIGVESLHPVTNNNHALGILRSLRDVPPAHYSLKIESLSLFRNTTNENYESGAFESGGYKWKLSLYPNGNKKRNVNDHISLYLAIADTNTLPLGWEANVNFKFFVFDHIRDIYLTIQEVGSRRFHRTKTEWGFDQFLPLNTFNNASNGYLHDDCCVFGAEVFVIRQSSKGECVSFVKPPAYNNTCTWKVDKFSAFHEESLLSEEFHIGEHKWRLSMYPKGVSRAKGESLLLFLELVDCKSLATEWKVYAEYKLRIKDQILHKHSEIEVKSWFSASSKSWGFSNFLPQRDLNDSKKGFLVKDAVIAEVQIILVSTLKDF